MKGHGFVTVLMQSTLGPCHNCKDLRAQLVFCRRYWFADAVVVAAVAAVLVGGCFATAVVAAAAAT